MAGPNKPSTNRHYFRISMDNEQLKLTQEALLFYAEKLKAECNEHDFRKLEEASRLCYNFRLILDGEKQTGRRRKFYLGRDTL